MYVKPRCINDGKEYTDFNGFEKNKTNTKK